MAVDKQMQVIMEMVRSEIHTHLQKIVPLIAADIEEVSTLLTQNLNDLLTRVEALEGATPVPAQKPKAESVPLPKDLEL